MPFSLVPIGTLCHAEKFSTCTHDGQPVVYGALRRARRLDLRRRGHDLGPGRGRAVRVEAGLLEHVLVVVEDRRRAVERERQHLALAGRVVAGDGADVGLGIELLAGLAHHLLDRLDRALRAHHRRRADLEHLQDVRRVACAERRDRGGHRLGILRPCRPATTLYSFWLSLKPLANSLTRSFSAPVIECHHWISVWACAAAVAPNSAAARATRTKRVECTATWNSSSGTEMRAGCLVLVAILLHSAPNGRRR